RPARGLRPAARPGRDDPSSRRDLGRDARRRRRARRRGRRRARRRPPVSAGPTRSATTLHDGSSYYGRPVLKEPVWTWEIPAYFFLGGTAGAANALSLGARLTGNRELADRLSLVATAGLAASPVLLVSDLGRPERFLNMLRVFKVTSPMSVGSWAI